MSKGLTIIAFIFVLPFIILGGLWMMAKKRPVVMSPGSAQGTAPQVSGGRTNAAPQTNTAQGTAPGGAGGAVPILNASAEVLRAGAPIIKGFFDAFSNDNSDYEADPSEAAVGDTAPIQAPFADAFSMF